MRELGMRCGERRAKESKQVKQDEMHTPAQPPAHTHRDEVLDGEHHPCHALGALEDASGDEEHVGDLHCIGDHCVSTIAQ